MKILTVKSVLILIAVWVIAAPLSAQIDIRPENRCAPYERDEYPYPQSIEQRIVSINLGGQIISPYTGEVFESLSETDIEHIVATSEAHDSGLCAAPAAVKEQFAQDLDNLTLASPTVNRHQKSDKDFAEWVPDENLCWFAATIVRVKAKYSLSIDMKEAAALLMALSNCLLPSAPPADDPAAPSATQGALALYDDNGNGRITCAEARRHGIVPVHREHPAYEYMSDSDGDGVVCE